MGRKDCVLNPSCVSGLIGHSFVCGTIFPSHVSFDTGLSLFLSCVPGLTSEWLLEGLMGTLRKASQCAM